jgi:aspartate/methionine/tyrosine aminotransferase
MLYIFKRFVPIPTSRDVSHNYQITPEHLKNEIIEKGLRVVVTSNPCNPTGEHFPGAQQDNILTITLGRVIEGEELKKWVEICKETGTSLILDEFYSHYIYTHPTVCLISFLLYNNELIVANRKNMVVRSVLLNSSMMLTMIQ